MWRCWVRSSRNFPSSSTWSAIFGRLVSQVVIVIYQRCCYSFLFILLSQKKCVNDSWIPGFMVDYHNRKPVDHGCFNLRLAHVFGSTPGLWLTLVDQGYRGLQQPRLRIFSAKSGVVLLGHSQIIFVEAFWSFIKGGMVPRDLLIGGLEDVLSFHILGIVIIPTD